jgi:hypothetical protein
MNEIEQMASRADEVLESRLIGYSICTVVTRHEDYLAMLRSFRAKGFVGTDCEFLYVDNTTGNSYDCFNAYNLFFTIARGRYIVLCHQDIRLLNDGRQQLDRILTELTKADPCWALAGNAGGVHPGRLALRITDPGRNNDRIGDLPARVGSLDENFIIARGAANLAVSADLEGFHFYGTDICLIADVLGYNAYVIDFHLKHCSAGTHDESFFLAKERLIEKYGRAFRSRWVQTTCAVMFLSKSSISRWMLNWLARTRGFDLFQRLAPQLARFLR